ncbi:hypothetical protein AB0L26_09320 [Streptomyces nondiastaticus]|uniref:hypothetical protein n=1 Tax=Streptomyces TaxID=1883 RepID=UPI0026765B69|nr:hypothetical protein [Streptomyces sp. VNUA116]WKU42686.1 hypothetical protein Q3V23_00570 [Streptomyces sp. VNUA116]
MASGGWNWFWVVSSMLLGQATVLASGIFNNRSQFRREALARRADRHKVIAERREMFELTHLVEVNTLLRNAMAALLAFNSARTLYRSRRQADPSALPESFQQPMTDASDASDAALDALRSQIGFILADNVRALASAAEEAITLAVSAVSLDEPVDFTMVSKKANTAYEALAARLRDIYATAEPTAAPG